MKNFNNDTEKIEFLRKYKLLSETSTDVSGFYYFYPESDTPVSCEIIGYEDKFETWAGIIIQIMQPTEQQITIHSDYLLDMKKRGRAYQKTKNTDPDTAYIVLDLETTGLNYKQDEIIEFAAIKYRNQESETFHELVKPTVAIPENITNLTGITNEMVQDVSSIDVVLPKFLEFIGSHKLIGHNIKSFDILFLNNACRTLGFSGIQNELVDTLPLARKKLPGLANYQMGTICKHYNIDTSGAHRALEDCRMCHACYQYLTGK